VAGLSLQEVLGRLLRIQGRKYSPLPVVEELDKERRARGGAHRGATATAAPGHLKTGGSECGGSGASGRALAESAGTGDRLPVTEGVPSIQAARAPTGASGISPSGPSKDALD
jgi:hypothetical protein